MAKIGNFGKLITFETSDAKVLNFNDFQRTVSANWTKHERIGKKPQSEFLNAELQGLTFSIVLDARHGVRPRTTIESIEAAVESGRVESLVIGSKKVGKNKWKITQMGEVWNTVLNKGELVRATINLTLEEYV